MNKTLLLTTIASIFLIPTVIATLMNNSNYIFDIEIASGSTNASSENFDTYFSISPGIEATNASSSNFKSFFGFIYHLKYINGDPCERNSDCISNLCCNGACATSCPLGEITASGGGPSGAGGGPTKKEEVVLKTDFSVAPSKIRIPLTIGEAAIKIFTITNTGETPLDMDISVSGRIQNLITISSQSLSLEPGGSAVITLNIISGIEPGSFVGKIGAKGNGITKDIPLTLDIETSNAVFDVSLDLPPNPVILEGDNLKAQITLFNIIGIPTYVTVTYLIKDLEGNILYESEETFRVEDQKSYEKKFNTQNLEQGTYVAVAEVRYRNSFAVSSQTFTIAPGDLASRIRAIKVERKILYAITILSLMIIGIFILRNRLKARKNSSQLLKNKRKIKEK